MELTNEQVIELFGRLARIEAKLEQAPPACAIHTEQITGLVRRVDDIEDQLGKVETVIGKKELLVALFGAIGIGFGFFIKYLWARLSSGS